MNMLRHLFVAAVLFAVGLVVGCGEGTPKPPAPLPPPTALTLEDWKKLPIEEKYDGATFERLKLNDPNLQHPRNWAAYEYQYIIPERKKDIPGYPGNVPQAAAK
jgi:hypothetical protein